MTTHTTHERARDKKRMRETERTKTHIYTTKILKVYIYKKVFVGYQIQIRR